MNNSWRCVTCGLLHVKSLYMMAHSRDLMRHTCRACGQVSELLDGAVSTDSCPRGKQDPFYWASNGHIPCVDPEGMTNVPMVLCVQVPHGWQMLRGAALIDASRKLSEARKGIVHAPITHLPVDDPTVTDWYAGDPPVRDGYYDIQFTNGVYAPRRWWWSNKLQQFLFDPLDRSGVSVGSIRAWRGLNNEAACNTTPA